MNVFAQVNRRAHRDVCNRPKSGSNLLEIGIFVANVIRSTQRGSKTCYPVLGSSGDCFFIEIASGEMESRNILRTVYVELQPSQKDSIRLQSESTGSDIIVSVSDASRLVALLGLFEIALGENTRSLHPLDANGNYFKDWERAVIAASEGIIS